MAEQLNRILSTSQGEFRDRGSKFFAHAIPVVSQEGINKEMTALKKQYHDARHHCYAWRLGRDGEETFAHDDGEPSHSAGDPILGTIRSAALTDVLIIVIRYFGGTKLGVRGLIEAYRTAAEDAICQAATEAIIPCIQFRVDFAYEDTSLINQLLHPFDITQVEASYTDTCSVTYAIRSETFQQIRQTFEDSGLEIVELEEVY